MDDYQRVELDERDRQAAVYDSWYVESKGRLFDELERDLFRRAARGAERVLDVGCGTGRIGGALDADVVGVDMSHQSLQHGRLRSACGSATKLPVRSDSVDAVTACQVLQHLQPADLAAALEDIARVLRPGGRLIVAGYNHASRRVKGPEDIHFDNGMYAHRTTAEGFAETAAAHGFRPAASRHYRTLPLHRLKRRAWREADRLLGASPLGRRSGDYFLVTLVK